MIEPDDDRLVYMKESDVLSAGGLVDAMRNRWFSVHPERGLIFWQSTNKRRGSLFGSSPQCNSREDVARTVTAKMYPWAEIRFYPLVLVPINLDDYQD